MAISKPSNIALFASAFLFAHAGLAQSPFSGVPEDFAQMEPISDDSLDSMRGGFITPGGLSIDFTLQNRTLIDGEMVADISLNAETLQNLSQADTLQKVVQVGGNNSVDIDRALSAAPGTTLIVQNTLDQKLIQNYSILDITVENYKEFQSNQPLNNALFSARTGL